MIMSTRPDMRVGMRLGVVTHVSDTRFVLPKASSAKRRAIWTSYPSFRPRTSMNPNGGKSHLTPISHRFRPFGSDGSGGNFGFFASDVAWPAVASGAATLHAANDAAANA